MSIKLAVRTQRRIKGKKYRPLFSTFLTAEGPAKGTIWFDRENPKANPFTIGEVGWSMGQRQTVWFTRGDNDGEIAELLEDFLQRAEEGRYVLIGVTPPHVHSHVEA